MYLSKLILNPIQSQVRRDIADAYEMHRTLSRAFAITHDQPPARFLWRLEAAKPAAAVAEASVLVQSTIPGDWSAITAIPGYTLHGSKQVSLEALLQLGRNYRFRLVANPTVTRGGKRYGLVGQESQQAWLVRQGERSGFTVLDAVSSGSVRLSVRQARKGHRITVDTVHFDGVLQATDVIALGKALVGGIGHAKAMGLGMLSLAPARL